MKEFRKYQSELESKLHVKISLSPGQIQFEGESYDEYAASLVFDAVDFGFNVKKALQLCDEETIFRRIHIKDHTRRKNLADVRARLIGSHGKTRRVIETVSNCDVIIHDTEVGILGNVNDVDGAETAVISLIKGTKQTNVYRYLEKRNAQRKEEG